MSVQLPDQMPDHIDDIEAESIELPRADLHGLWRVLLWGASAAMALAIVAGTAFSDLGTDRFAQVMASLTGSTTTETKTENKTETQLQTAEIEPIKIEPQRPQIDPQQLAGIERQTRELAQAVRELTAERAQLKVRLASLEQNLGDITGAIKRQSAQLAAQAETAAQQKAELAEATQVATPPPDVSRPQTVAAVPPPVTTAPPAEPPAATGSTPPVIEASPPIEGPIPLPRSRVAALEAHDPANREVGVDLGGASSLEALRTHWSAVKANAGPELTGLTPSYTVRQTSSGGSDYRLVLGPLPSTAAAVQLCGKLATSRVSCRAGTFSVQRFAERAAERERPRPPAHLPSVIQNSIMSR
jgi:hypothetical protein